MRVDGSQQQLPEDVDRAANRIVQEALTNVTRHADAVSASVVLAYGPGTLTVQVDDDGMGADGHGPAPGHGLTGMHERVSALGGRLDAASRPEGGFSVRAELPVPAS